MHDEYMDASSTDMEHMEGLIKEHQEVRPVGSRMRLQEPTTIPYERIQRTITVLQQRFRTRQSERMSEKGDSSVASYLAHEQAKRQEELSMMQQS